MLNCTWDRTISKKVWTFCKLPFKYGSTHPWYLLCVGWYMYDVCECGCVALRVWACLSVSDTGSRRHTRTRPHNQPAAAKDTGTYLGTSRLACSAGWRQRPETTTTTTSDVIEFQHHHRNPIIIGAWDRSQVRGYVGQHLRATHHASAAAK